MHYISSETPVGLSEGCDSVKTQNYCKQSFPSPKVEICAIFPVNVVTLQLD